MSASFDVHRVREQFPALARQIGGRPAVFLDGPAGSQVPRKVLDAMQRYLIECNANHGGLFPTSRESDALLDEAHRATATFVGSHDAGEVAFGANMTTMTLALARTLGRTWGAGDEILLTHMEHDANFTPWVQAAEDAGATVKVAGIRREDVTLDLDDWTAKLSDRTCLVAVGAASNAVGTLNPVREIARRAHEAGALVFVDAVHHAPHYPIDVAAWGCDFLACSAYKFFGPHVGILWGRRELMEKLPVYKLRPPSDGLPDRWETGTLNHEGIAGTMAAIGYLADLGRASTGTGADLRTALLAGYAAIDGYERGLLGHLLAGLDAIRDVTIWGITDARRFDERAPTVAITHARHTARQMAEELGRQGIFTWDGNFYALPLTGALGLEPDGVLRIGLLHYNTREEVDRLLGALRELG
jgi:cysteine desulfurase family protein (TIGR01976 family)